MLLSRFKTKTEQDKISEAPVGSEQCKQRKHDNQHSRPAEIHQKA